MIKREIIEKTSKTHPSPSLGQLKEWINQDVTKWILARLYHRYPDYRQALPIRTQEQALTINFQVGCRETLEALEKLVETGEF